MTRQRKYPNQFRRRVIAVGIPLLALLMLGQAVAQGPSKGSGAASSGPVQVAARKSSEAVNTPPDIFPPLPSPAERVSNSAKETEAGAVILEDVTEISGKIPEFREPWSARTRRVRFLVLNEKGAEALARHAFFGDTSEAATSIRGRTVTADGQVFPVDRRKDVRRLEIKDATGKVESTVRTVFFPHVEPGAVLDLAWSVKIEGTPSFEVIGLQAAFPIRKLKLKTRGKLTSQIFWVPFFIGPVPPGAHVTVDESLNLDLEIVDLARIPDEPFSPPPFRTGYILGLMPKFLGGSFFLSGSKAAAITENLVVLGPSSAEAQRHSGDMDPAQALVRFDALALQLPPE